MTELGKFGIDVEDADEGDDEVCGLVVCEDVELEEGQDIHDTACEYQQEDFQLEVLISRDSV